MESEHDEMNGTNDSYPLIEKSCSNEFPNAKYHENKMITVKKRERRIHTEDREQISGKTDYHITAFP